jgi:hypothetical protein
MMASGRCLRREVMRDKPIPLDAPVTVSEGSRKQEVVSCGLMNRRYLVVGHTEDVWLLGDVAVGVGSARHVGCVRCCRRLTILLVVG